MKNQVIRFADKIVVLPSNMRWEIDKIENNGKFKKTKIKFADFPDVTYLGCLGNNHIFDMKGLHNQTIPKRAYCKIVIKD